ncbi:isocitrate lyase family protein, partial [Vibrio parahaemolyticus AQ3810]
RSWCRHDLP